MDWHTQLGLFPSSRYDFGEGGCREGAFTFGNKNILGIRVIASDFSKGPEFRAEQRMGAGGAVFPAVHMKQTIFQVNLRPTQ